LTRRETFSPIGTTLPRSPALARKVRLVEDKITKFDDKSQNHENRSNSSISFSKSLNFATLGCLFHDGPQGATVHREAVWDGTYTEGNTASDVTWVFEKQKHQFDTKVVKIFIKDSI
jgi:hypothetical protein